MQDLPHIARVDSAVKLNNIIYEEDEKRRNDKVLAFLNQAGLISASGHRMQLKKSTNTDGWWWRCLPKSFQKTESIRNGTFFSKIELTLGSFAFSF